MRIEKRNLINSIVFFFFLFIPAYFIAYAETIEDESLTSEEIIFTEETDEGSDSNSESNIELTTFPNPIFIGPTFIPSPFFFASPFFFPRFIAAPVFVNPFFFSFGFSFFTDPFFFSFGFPFFFNCPSFFSPFAFNSFIFFPHHHRHRFHHGHHVVHHNPSKFVKTGVPIKKPITNPVNGRRGGANNLQSRRPAKNSFGTIINPSSGSRTMTKAPNNKTGFRLFGSKSNTITSNSPFKRSHLGKAGISNFSRSFRGNSFGRMGRTSIGKIGGSFRRFGRR